MKMFRRVFIFSLLFSLSFFLFSQDFITEDGTIGNKEKKTAKAKWSDRLIFGGNFMLEPYSYNGYSVFYADVSPMVGYMVTDRFIAGNYFIFRYYGNDYYRFYTSIYGVKPYLRYRLIKNLDNIMPFDAHFNTGITLVASQEFLNVEKRIFYEGPGRKWIAGTLAGFSIVQPLGTKGGFYISLLWLVAGDQNILITNNYYSPIIDFGFYL